MDNRDSSAQLMTPDTELGRDRSLPPEIRAANMAFMLSMGLPDVSSKTQASLPVSSPTNTQNSDQLQSAIGTPEPRNSVRARSQWRDRQSPAGSNLPRPSIPARIWFLFWMLVWVGSWLTSPAWMPAFVHDWAPQHMSWITEWIKTGSLPDIRNVTARLDIMSKMASMTSDLSSLTALWLG